MQWRLLCSTVIGVVVDVMNSSETRPPERKMSVSAASVISDLSQTQGGVSRMRSNLKQSLEDDKLCQATTITTLIEELRLAKQLCRERDAERKAVSHLREKESLHKKEESLRKETEFFQREEELKKRILCMEESGEAEILAREEELKKSFLLVLENRNAEILCREAEGEELTKNFFLCV